MIISVAKREGECTQSEDFLLSRPGIYINCEYQTMKVNLEYLTSPLVKQKQMQNVQHNNFGHFLMPIVIPKLPTSG